MKIGKKIICLLASVFLCAANASAKEAPYSNYLYDDRYLPVAAPSTYVPETVIDGAVMGTRLSSPQDLFVDAEGHIFIADTENNRVLKLGEDYRLETEFARFSGGETLNKPAGVFAKNGLVYIADTGNARVIICDSEKNVTQIITRPDSGLLEDAFVFAPEKLLTDSDGNLFVLSRGAYKGLMTFNPDGTFMGFFGGNSVKASLQLMMDRLWRNFMTKEQIASSRRYVGTEHANIDIDGNDFIYTCDLSGSNQVKQLNALGTNVLHANENFLGKFGDLNTEFIKNQVVQSTIVDVNISGDEIISCLDSTRGRVFQYDRECNLIGVFGSLGGQEGTFKVPAALDNLGSKILVLDSGKNNITVFARTEFGDYISQAVSLYNEGLYEEAIVPWQEVLKRNANSEMAYNGLGKAYLKLKDYDKAMEYFTLAVNNKGYSDAFAAKRNLFVRANFFWLFSVAAILSIGTVILVKWLAAQRKKRRENR